jgi:hypothetical protein
LAAEQTEDKSLEERFSFPPGSSQPRPLEKYQAQKRKEPEYYPTPTTPAYNPDNYRLKIGLATEVCAERSVRHVFRSGGKRKPTLTLPSAWADALGLDLKNKHNGNDTIMMELSADRESITIRKMRPPIEMSKPVDAEIFAADSDAAAEMLEDSSSGQK